MSEAVPQQRSVLMLTADRQIDRRILLGADSLEADGWKVTIVAMPPDTAGTDDPRVIRVGAGAQGLQRESLVLDTYRWVRSRVPMNGRLMRWMKRLTWRYLVDQETFHTRLFDGTVAGLNADVVVANDLPMLPLGSQLAAVSGARLVYDSHELFSEQEFSEREKQRWKKIEAKYIGTCDAVITVNHSIASELQQRYGIRQVHVIHNAERSMAPPVRSRLLHQKFGLAADTKVLLFQGGLSAGRNLEELVSAMAHVRIPSVVLVVLGDGMLSERLQAKVKAQHWVGKVFFHSAVPQQDLLALTAAADAGVIPYQAICLNNYYCTPNKLFEFIAAGLPILASDLPEIRRLVEGRDIGLVGDMDSAEKIARLIDHFFSDEQRLSAWQANLMSVRKQVCWEVESKKLTKIYEALQ